MAIQFHKKDLGLFTEIGIDIRKHPDKYHSAGEWLNRYYEDAEFCRKQREGLKQYNRRLITEIKELESEIKDCNPDDSFGPLDKLEGSVFTKKQRREFISKLTNKKQITLKERLAYAIEHLFHNCTCGGVLSEKDTRALLLIVWISTDAEGDRANLNITKFADLPWGAGVNGFDFAYFGSWWMEGECDSKDDCGGADLDFSGAVDREDLKILCEWWLGV